MLIAGVQCLPVHLSLRPGPVLRLVQVKGLPARSRSRQRRAESLLRLHAVEMLVEVRISGGTIVGCLASDWRSRTEMGRS